MNIALYVLKVFFVHFRKKFLESTRNIQIAHLGFHVFKKINSEVWLVDFDWFCLPVK
mgnify:CR=1 FL=1